MKRIGTSALVSLSLLSACSSDKTASRTAAPAQPAATPPAVTATPPAVAATPPAAATPAETPKLQPETPKPPAAAEMDAAIAVLMAKPELPDEFIQIQHVLVGFQGASRKTSVTRSKEEAKVLAQKVYAEAIGGADFDALVKQYTDDSAPGIYQIFKSRRVKFVKGFGDVGFRLKVGEIGVAPWDATASPFGWHIIKRLK